MDEKGAGKPDLIERAVGALFGRKALQAAEPFGMKRMSDEAYAEQSIATLTELAAPLAGDSEDVRLFRPLLARTRLEKAPLRWMKAMGHEPHAPIGQHEECL